MNPQLYNDYGSWIRSQFNFRIQKISIDGGFSCPNRDGTVSAGGCTFCDNRTFNPSYCNPAKSIREQIQTGKDFFARKYPTMRYLAYFQAYSNTYAPLDTLRRRYEEALSQDGVVGIVIGTRPDCVTEETLDYLEELSRSTFVIVEYGIESVDNATLKRINRGHTFECSRDAIIATHERGILTGGHIILGLPGETAEDNIRQAAETSALPLDILKLHQLQIIRGTQLAEDYLSKPFKLYTADEYIDVCIRYIERLRKDLVLERFVSQSPADMLIAPKWGIKNHEFTDRLVNELKRRRTWQGRLL
jgi:radical SAM protein, TIGR01212 family|uniref:TIGR01212 family radical SAM protein n=1 Tax=Prevotella sp. TaxID=59823 RepID=UPI0040271F24